MATVSASPSSGLSYGIRIVSASPILDRVNITVANTGGTGSYGYGIVSTGGTGGHPIIRRTVITAYGAVNEYGIWCDLSGAPQEIRDLQIFASGATNIRGIYFATDDPFYLTRLTQSRIEINGPSTNVGIERAGAGSIYVEQSQIRASAGSISNIGVLNNLISPLQIDHSEISAATATVSGPARIGATKLIGGPAALAQCAGVYDENYTFFPGLSCP